MGSEVAEALPYFSRGEVVRGFGRGSKQLGIPTANFPEEVVELLPAAFETGVYWGLARVNSGPCYRMVMSIGWNPHFENEKKSMECHLLHEFAEDFYGSTLSVCIAGYIRPQEKYNSLEKLIDAIKSDIEVAKSKLTEAEMVSLSKQLEDHFRTEN